MNPFESMKLFCGIAEEVATELGVLACVSIVDDSGELVLLSRMPGVSSLAREMSESKAYTSIMMGCESGALAEQVLPGEPLYGLTMAFRRIVPFGGGSCVDFDGVRYGVGVSGGSMAQDVEVLHETQRRLGHGDWAERSQPAG